MVEFVQNIVINKKKLNIFVSISRPNDYNLLLSMDKEWSYQQKFSKYLEQYECKLQRKNYFFGLGLPVFNMPNS